DLLEQQRRLEDAQAAAAVLLGDRDPEPSGVCERLVELPRELVLLVLLGPVLVVERGREIRHRPLNRLLIIGELEVHRAPPNLRERPFTDAITSAAPNGTKMG